jgi:hypothetical protein
MQAYATAHAVPSSPLRVVLPPRRMQPIWLPRVPATRSWRGCSGSSQNLLRIVWPTGSFPGARRATSGSTHGRPPNTSASTATRFAGSPPSAPSRPSRRGQAASSTSGGRTSTIGGARAQVRSRRLGSRVDAMTDRAVAPRRVRVERGIYRRSTGVLEVGFKDETGRQRWRTVEGGILAAPQAAR